MKLVQEENETFLDYSRRTDELAARLGMNLEDLPQVIGISRASLFCYRTGKRPISGKAWAKLDAAEQQVSKSTIHPAVVSEEGLQKSYGRKRINEKDLLAAWQQLSLSDRAEIADEVMRMIFRRIS